MTARASSWWVSDPEIAVQFGVEASQLQNSIYINYQTFTMRPDVVYDTTRITEMLCSMLVSVSFRLF